MSNVLIGIIGVILFIGLALAGALFLGNEFQRSTNNSRAAAITQGLSQIANAANLRNVQTGTDILSGAAVSTLVPGFLKSVPINPVDSALGPRMVAQDDVSSTTLSADIAVMPLPATTVGQNVCQAIHTQSGGSGAPPVLASGDDITGVVERVTGCFQSTAANSALGVAAGGRVAYVRF